MTEPGPRQETESNKDVPPQNTGEITKSAPTAETAKAREDEMTRAAETWTSLEPEPTAEQLKARLRVDNAKHTASLKRLEADLMEKQKLGSMEQ